MPQGPGQHAPWGMLPRFLSNGRRPREAGARWHAPCCGGAGVLPPGSCTMMSLLPSEPRPLRVLLAEDDEEMRMLLTLTLARAGCVVVALEDGFELSDYVSLTQVYGGPLPPPDLILSDV